MFPVEVDPKGDFTNHSLSPPVSYSQCAELSFRLRPPFAETMAEEIPKTGKLAKVIITRDSGVVFTGRKGLSRWDVKEIFEKGIPPNFTPTGIFVLSEHEFVIEIPRPVSATLFQEKIRRTKEMGSQPIRMSLEVVSNTAKALYVKGVRGLVKGEVFWHLGDPVGTSKYMRKVKDAVDAEDVSDNVTMPLERKPEQWVKPEEVRANRPALVSDEFAAVKDKFDLTGAAGASPMNEKKRREMAQRNKELRLKVEEQRRQQEKKDKEERRKGLFPPAPAKSPGKPGQLPGKGRLASTGKPTAEPGTLLLDMPDVSDVELSLSEEEVEPKDPFEFLRNASDSQMEQMQERMIEELERRRKPQEKKRLNFDVSRRSKPEVSKAETSVLNTSQTLQALRQIPRIPDFTGGAKGLGYENWVSAVNGLDPDYTEAQKREAVLRSLKDDAQTAAYSLGPVARLSDILSKLNDLFGRAGTAAQAAARMYKTLQDKEESVSKFAVRLETNVNLLMTNYPNYLGQTSEQVMQGIFAQGLRPAIRAAIRYKSDDPTASYGELLRVARGVEEDYQAKEGAKETSKKDTTPARNVKSAAAEAKPGKVFSEGELAKVLKSLMAQPGGANGKSGNGKKSDKNNNRSRNDNRDRTGAGAERSEGRRNDDGTWYINGNCHNCGEHGHMKRQCKSERRGRSSRGRSNNASAQESLNDQGATVGSVSAPPSETN